MSGNKHIVLRIGVLEARDLAAADRDGLSDPYVVVRVGAKKYQTPTIHKNLNPVWNTIFDVKLGPDKIPAHITITVWDEDRIGRDFLGEVTIPMKQVFARNNGGINDGRPLAFDDARNQQAAFTLQKRSSKNEVKGEIILKFGLVDDDATNIRTEDDWYYFWEALTSQIETR